MLIRGVIEEGAVPAFRTTGLAPRFAHLAEQSRRARALLRRLACAGRGRQCPLCGWEGRRFLPRGEKFAVIRESQVVGGGFRPDAECPRCGCLDRERHVYLFLREKTAVFSRPFRLLHIAPEPQLQALFRRCPHLEYLSVDLTDPAAMMRMDVTALRCPEESFDGLLCNHVLEHVRDDRKALSELWRVLRPEGWAILQVPFSPRRAHTDEDAAVTSPAERERRFGQRDHVRLYGLDYVNRLCAAGFLVSSYSYADEHSAAGAARFCLLPGERIFVGRKPSSGGAAEGRSEPLSA